MRRITLLSFLLVGSCTELIKLGLTQFCGDEVVKAPEVCDPPLLDGCNADCTKIETCGDSVLDDNEQCDDGNRIGGDGCNSNCQTEILGCGNNFLDAGENCDNGPPTPGDRCNDKCQKDGCDSPELIVTTQGGPQAVSPSGVSLYDGCTDAGGPGEDVSFLLQLPDEINLTLVVELQFANNPPNPLPVVYLTEDCDLEVGECGEVNINANRATFTFINLNPAPTLIIDSAEKTPLEDFTLKVFVF